MSRDGQRAGAATLLQWAGGAAEAMQRAGLFFGHGTATAFDEACWMLSHVLELPPDFDDATLTEALQPAQVERLDALLGRRIDTRKPLAYLIGEAWFAGLRFRVDESTLVPRSPLAELIVGGLLPWQDLTRPLRVLDVGTGSGCIAAALAWYWPALQVDAVDVSPAALAMARDNVTRLGLAERVRLIEADVYDGLSGPGGERARYDLIVSNPPYVPAASMAALPDEYRHEPALALGAGGDGLDIVRRLLAGAPEHLNGSGFLLLEVGEAQPATEVLLGDAPSIWLEFEHGGEGVVLLDRAACLEVRDRNVVESQELKT